MKTLMEMQPSQENTLTEMLEKQQGEYRYLLLDPLKTVSDINPLYLPTLRSVLGERAVTPVLRRDLAYSPPHCPQLVLLASPGERCDFSWLAGSEEYARSEAWHEKRYLCAWLFSTLPPVQLATALAEQCNQLTEHSFIPLFEPLRFELLQTMSSQEQLAGIVWPVSHWWYVKTSGDITCQAGKAHEERWSLNWGIEKVQQEIRPIWQLLFAWQRVNPALPDDAAMRAANAWQETAKTGLTDHDDRHFLALNRLTLPVDIEQHPAVRRLLQQAIADPDQSFTQLLKALPDAVWQELENTTAPQQYNDKGIDRHGA